MKYWALLLLLLTSPAWAQFPTITPTPTPTFTPSFSPTPTPSATPTPSPTPTEVPSCQTFNIGASSTQVWPGWPVPLKYLLIQNVSAVGGAEAYCSLGTNNAVTVSGGTLLTAHGGAWLPSPPIPANLDLACISTGGTAQVQVCWW